MSCPYIKECGGCPFRQLGEAEYKKKKIETFSKIMASLSQKEIAFGNPIFIGDNTRRRAEFSFEYRKGKLTFGFNARQTHEIADIQKCALLTDELNDILPTIREFLAQICRITIMQKAKGKKLITSNINKGQIFLTACANGIDINLEIAGDLALDHRLLIAELLNDNPQIISFSYKNSRSQTEIVAQKSAPFINIADQQIKIPSATFLQASEQSEAALIGLVKQYAGEVKGNIADLFCGIGTFSYPLATEVKNKITSVDSSEALLNEFQNNINRLMIPNIKILKRNLFKYPLQGDELKGFSLIVFDPPRAGASEQVKKIVELKPAEKPQKIIAVSCNPHTFVNDANILLAGGYCLKQITMVDQFNYSNHTELVALFEKI